MTDFPKWKWTIGAYEDEELRVVTFKNSKEAHRAVTIRDEDPALKDAPYQVADGRTLFVPIEMIPHLRRHGLKFSVSELLDPDELSPQDREEFEQERRHHTM